MLLWVTVFWRFSYIVYDFKAKGGHSKWNHQTFRLSFRLETRGASQLALFVFAVTYADLLLNLSGPLFPLMKSCSVLSAVISSEADVSHKAWPHSLEWEEPALDCWGNVCGGGICLKIVFSNNVLHFFYMHFYEKENVVSCCVLLTSVLNSRRGNH